MTLIPRSDKKRVYAILSFVPAFALYLVLQAYMYIVNLRFLADVVLFAGILAVTAVLTVLFTKIRIAWWLRRWKFALGRLWVIVKAVLVNIGVLAIYFGCRFLSQS